MPFNIELMSGDVAVKIQVVNKVINIYFNGDREKAIEKREKWEHLNGYFVKDLPNIGSEYKIFLNSGAYHRKREHTNLRECTLIHAHCHFQVEINPELFSSYLNGVYKQQIERFKEDPEYTFFIDMNEVEQIIKAFTEYYNNYKRSGLEADYEKETRLSPKEQKEHKKDVKEAIEIRNLTVAKPLGYSLFKPQGQANRDALKEIDVLDEIGNDLDFTIM